MRTMRKGFTLIELIIAIALFSILVGIAAGGFTSALRTQRQVAALISAQSNASLTLEQMARELRTGYLFCHDVSGNPTCTCTGGAGPNSTLACDNFIDFHNSETADVNYELTNGALERSENGGALQPITAANVSVQYLTFRLFGSAEGDHWNPRITVSMGVAPSSTDPAVSNTILNLQTTVSARAIDCGATGC